MLQSRSSESEISVKEKGRTGRRASERERDTTRRKKKAERERGEAGKEREEDRCLGYSNRSLEKAVSLGRTVPLTGELANLT